MTTQLNWKKIRSEFNRLADVDTLKSEVHRIGTEIRKFDFHTVLSPAAQQKVKTFEKRYTTLMRTISQAQRQVDREFNRILREVKVRRKDVNKAVTQQKTKLEAVTKQFKKYAKSAKKTGSATTKKRAATKKRK